MSGLGNRSEPGYIGMLEELIVKQWAHVYYLKGIIKVKFDFNYY